jgi:hypothetical protein
MGGTCILAINNFVEILRVGYVGRFQAVYLRLKVRIMTTE